MKMHLLEYTCVLCGNVFLAPQIVGGYGTLLLRSEEQGLVAIVDAITDPVFGEVGDVLTELGAVQELSERDRGALKQAVFGFTCDPAPDGTRYRIGAKPHCPACGSGAITHWQATEPPHFVEIDVPHVTHHSWDSMSARRRHNLLREAVASVRGDTRG